MAALGNFFTLQCLRSLYKFLLLRLGGNLGVFLNYLLEPRGRLGSWCFYLSFLHLLNCFLLHLLLVSCLLRGLVFTLFNLAFLFLLLSNGVKNLYELGDVAVFILLGGGRQAESSGRELLDDVWQRQLTLLRQTRDDVGVSVGRSLHLRVAEDQYAAILLDELNLLDAGDAGSANGAEPELETLVITNNLAGLLDLPPGGTLASSLGAGNTHPGAEALARRQHVWRHLFDDFSTHRGWKSLGARRLDVLRRN
ncbi:hypothetical protein BOVATA_024890 [Babesia ovata]|uniref:Uncharacterized protein n=1 Tax=Babesia ovata TaxID=189622 RepID=A0A2H6KDC9_9APIC|nr:uncharacterized protein BOVATA_024890 [Babesia ovata]GBE60996.1 hypothetical protein BOVATA_024890 [Babesia ovata]